MRWTNQEMEELKRLYPQGIPACMQALGKSRTSIKSMACRMGITTSPAFTEEEINYLKEHGAHKSVAYLSKEMKRSWPMVNNALGQLNIKFNNTQGRWIPTEDEIQVMKSGISFHEMRIKLNKAIPTILRNMRAMSLIEPKQKRWFNPNYIARTRSEPKPAIPCVPRSTGGEDRIASALRRLGL